MASKNQELFRRFMDEVVTKGRMENIDHMIAREYVEHEPLEGATPDREGLKQWISTVRKGFPDIRVRVEDLLEDGDKVVGRTVWEGTHKGQFLGIEPTNRKVSFEAIDIVKFRNGVAVEHWGVTDNASLLEQVGVLQPIGPPAR